MIKGSKAIYILGSAIIGILTVLVVYFSLIGTGAVNIVEKKIVVSSSSSTKEYDGTPLLSSAYSITEGELNGGHTLTVVTTGSQTDVGSSDNFFTATIQDENGFDCTKDYDIECRFGTLTVSKRAIVISVGNVEKTYNGKEQSITESDIESLTCSAKFALTGESLTDNGFNAEISIDTPAVGTNAGTYENNFSWSLKNADGIEFNDDNSVITVSGGNLVINKKVIEIQAKNETVDYETEPYRLETAWEFVPETDSEGNAVVEGTYADFFEQTGHGLKVSVEGNSIAGPGVSKITISDPSVVDKDGNNVTSNYDIKVNASGQLVMKYKNNTSPLDLSAPALKIYSDDDRVFYLKESASDSYSGGGAVWSRKADAYETFKLNGNNYSADYLVSTRLTNYATPIEAEIELEIAPFCLSYFLSVDNTGYGIQTDDRVYSSDKTKYTFSCIPYDYLTDGKPLGAYTGELKTYEEGYRAFVHENYLTLGSDASTAILNRIIEEKGFKNGDSSVANVKKVVEYIRSAITYDMACEKDADSEDNVIYFLSGETKKGVCRHYATCATLLFRALGIPARYACGYYAVAYGGAWTNVEIGKGHAWTEIYVDGLGWVPLEVTGGFDGDVSGGSGGSGGFGECNVENIKDKEITLTPRSYRVEYVDGETYCLFDYYNEIFKGEGYFDTHNLLGTEDLVRLGYVVSAKINNITLSSAGKSYIEIESYKIELNGVDVTSEFTKVKTASGVFQAYKYEVILVTGSKTAEYTGKEITCTDGCYVKNLPEGFTTDSILTTGSIINVGSTANKATVSIYDSLGNDVTDLCYVINEFGTLEVKQKKITITAASAEFTVTIEDIINSTPISKTCNKATVSGLGDIDVVLENTDSEGNLVGNVGEFKITVKVSGTFAGQEVDNAVDKDSIKIELLDGTDVTKNFEIKTVNGKLSATFA